MEEPTPQPRRSAAAARSRIGAIGEQLALEHYERLGFTLIERNYRTRWGKLDPVVSDVSTLVFAEVKTGGRRSSVAPLERLHSDKQRRVRRMAGAWLHEHRDRPRLAAVRFDAIIVTVDASARLVALEHLEGAF
jgi:putative endonuclease